MILCPEQAICRISMTQFMGTVKTSVIHSLWQDVLLANIKKKKLGQEENPTTHPIRQPLRNMPSDVRSV